MADEQNGTPETATPELDPVVDQGLQRIADLEKTNADLKDQLLRSLAEMENLRRRTAREIADARSYSVSAFARDVLTVGDNLARALDAVSEEARATGGDALHALMEGVEITERELTKALEKHGVTRVEPKGEKFDPNFHQAMFEVPDPSVPTGTVVQVMQAGFKIGDRVLRPALVGVGRGGPKAAPAPAEAPSATSAEAPSEAAASDEAAEPAAETGQRVDRTV